MLKQSTTKHQQLAADFKVPAYGDIKIDEAKGN